MFRDIEACERLGCDVVVFGVLDEDGNVAMRACRDLVHAARGLGVTFHRAFDVSRDPARALEDVVALGCERVLTSGQQPAAIEGAPLIRALIEQAARRIVIMPGAGIDSGNITALREATGATEFHASAKCAFGSAMRYRSDRLIDMSAGEMRSDRDEIHRMAERLRQA
jgi:copper homeostasis protein